MNDLVLLGKALSDPTRIRILDVLRDGELCVCEIADALEMSQSTLSTHLQTIRQAGLVATRKSTKWVYYRLEEKTAPLLETLFTFYNDAFLTDQRLQRDRQRVQQRLQLRVDGCCVVGTQNTNLLEKGTKSDASEQ